MNCYPEWQPRITRRYSHGWNVSNKNSIFHYPGVCTSLHVLPASIFLGAKTSSCAGHLAYLHPERWVTGLRGLCLLPLPNTESRAALNMKELYLRLTGGPSVSELNRSRPNKFLKC